MDERRSARALIMTTATAGLDDYFGCLRAHLSCIRYRYDCAARMPVFAIPLAVIRKPLTNTAAGFGLKRTIGTDSAS